MRKFLQYFMFILCKQFKILNYFVNKSDNLVFNFGKGNIENSTAFVIATQIMEIFAILYMPPHLKILNNLILKLITLLIVRTI